MNASKIKIMLLVPVLLSTGCFHLVPLDGNPPIRIPVDPGGNYGGDGIVLAPQVQLTVSNPAPIVGETVELVCSTTNDAGSDVDFSFQPDTGDLIQTGPGANTAQLIVDESDINVTFEFTCSGTNSAGTGPPSQPVAIIPQETEIVGP